MDKNDLELHYQRMSKRFYLIGGVDDPNLKQAFLASIPKPLGEETFRLLSANGRTLQNTTLGELFQTIMRALEKMCSQNKFLQEYMKQTKQLDKVCSPRDLTIKCSTKSSCSCERPSYGGKRYKSKSFKPRTPWKFLRRKNRPGKSSNRCFLCGQKWHFAKQCPKGKTAKMISHIQDVTGVSLSDDDVESVFSIEDEISPYTVCALRPFSHSDDNSAGDIFKMNAINSVQSIPMEKMQIIPTKYSKPIKVAAFFDTGASYTIMNPDILPPEFWKKKKQYFHAANNQIFCTELISKPIKLQFFPGCSIVHRVIGSKLPGKDLIIGFDLYTKKKGLRILPQGLAYKQYFTLWEQVPNYFHMTEDCLTSIKERIIQKSCANSLMEFSNKCDHPLWKNEEFFISLPFKMNEDANPTKASHLGIGPDHQSLANKECEELKAQGLIEETESPWACHAFYVNNRSEQARGKQRLVINYQPLNHFLTDDKFPLPNRNSLFSSLSQAKVFSKFDLKAGFWQLGVKKEDRPKTAFCIPNHHFQWTVMPFGLKTAPSPFQKAMSKIYKPILNQALIYIDDILLFSPDIKSHTNLLTQFAGITEKYGIMLSEKKMVLGQPKIEFLGMKLHNGTYEAQPHIA
ncbi:uncharacterized protein LOC133795762 [Humulus lupulus]|uniref:uncharacterized protein LOC133795762 n=1 Tax=Humulus lupulus TaxID=3486 RepID=UPI002B40D815|nr:uncharacterized protein LOC133795762 [Humulus lupulus]